MTKTSALPKYIQLSEMLIRDIAAGRLVDGSRLPTERDMAGEMGVAVGTLRKALSDVEAKGLLERVHGSGNYVRRRVPIESVYAFFRLEKLDGGGLPTAQVLSVDLLDKPDDAPAFGQNRQGYRVRRVRSLDSTLIALEEIWFDAGRAGQFDRTELSESLYQFYRSVCGVVISAVEDWLGVGDIPDWAPDDFHLQPGTTVGFIERLGNASDLGAFEYSRTWFDPNRARYVSRMGKG